MRAIDQIALVIVQFRARQHFQKQALSMHGLTQVMAGGGKEFGFGSAGIFGFTLCSFGYSGFHAQLLHQFDVFKT